MEKKRFEQKNQRNHKRMMVMGVVIALAVAVIVGAMVVSILNSEDVEEVEVDETAEVEKELEEEYGFVEPETVENLVAKFNAKIMDQTGWELMPTDDATLVTHENNYWYPLDEDLALVVVPVEFSGDKAQDEVLTMLIYVGKDAANQEKAQEYWKYVVQANDDSLSAEEVAELMAEAEELRERGEMANHGGGIFVAISEGEGTGADHREYQVVRNYREG